MLPKRFITYIPFVMLLIADSGSSKTEWRLLNAQAVAQKICTAGLNPYFQTSEQMVVELQTHLLPVLQENTVTSIYFYGAGCSSDTNRTIVKNALQRIFTHADITIDHDMLAAARALCGHEAGIACILGTGVNICLYDGKDIIGSRPSLGFWLADEGGGGYLGKTLVQQYFHEELPTDLHQKFQTAYALTVETVLENAYKKPFPNSYFASFSRFLTDNQEHPYVQQLLYEAFDLFTQRYICQLPGYQKYSVHFTGSVSFYYQDILRKVLSDRNIQAGIILAQPIDGLLRYHQQAKE